MIVSQIIGTWYDSNKRFLPWRETRNPYYIWLSEIILQQTRVNQGFAYYQRFIEMYPTLNDIAAAKPDEVLLLWQGLGYYSRARNLHKTAQLLIEKYNGQFPEEYELLLGLPGIGEYTAGAIASLAFNKPVVAIDGNVYRVLARFLGIDIPVHSFRGKLEFRRAAEELLDCNNPGRHNQAMIELGALVCLPVNPKCPECPLHESCYGYKMAQVNHFPVKKKKAATTNRYFYYLVFHKNDKIIVRQRGDNDIWALMYDFPLIEMKRAVPLSKLLKGKEWKAMLGLADTKIKKISNEFNHILSHQALHAWFIELEVDEAFQLSSTVEIDLKNIVHYPVPRLIEKYLTEMHGRDAKKIQGRLN
jgi:A/G-specific adenine glycosylase